MDTFKGRRRAVNKKPREAPTEARVHSRGVDVKTERTYCFTTVCNQTRRLLEGLLQVVLEPLVLVLFGAQLHEFAWKQENLR